MNILSLKIFPPLLLICLIFYPLIGWNQNVLLKGKTVNYYNSRKIKGVNLKVFLNDSVIAQTQSKGAYKIKLQKKGILKVSFSKDGFIDKHFLVNTSTIPKYYLKKKYTISAEVSMTKKDKYMGVNKIENAVGYVYYNPKYRGFIWDPEYTKRAQVAMDAIIFPLDEVVQLDSALNKQKQTYFYQKGLNYYINIQTNPEQIFKESSLELSKSKINNPIQRGYYYGKFTYALLQEDLDLCNSISVFVRGPNKEYSNLAEGIKDCKRLDTLVLNDKYAAVGYWMNLVNYADTNEIIAFTNIAHSITLLQKQFSSLDMTDAELSFHAEFKKAVKAAEMLYQKIKSSTKTEIKNVKYYAYTLNQFKTIVTQLARNSFLTKD